MNKEDNNENKLPKLSIEEENVFKKLKLNLEHGANFFGKTNDNLPPEIEGQFLDYVSHFENAYQNAKIISVYEKIGRPEFKLGVSLSDDEIIVELERIEELMHQNRLHLDTLCDYENKNRLIYSFITEELFSKEIEDMDLPGIMTNFIYEEFHQNHKYDLELATEDFLSMFFNTESDFYDEYHSKDATNHEKLNNFRSFFENFKMKFFSFKDISFDEQNAKVVFNIDFSANIKGSDSINTYSGNGSMTFEYEYGYWYVRKVDLPIKNQI